MRLAPLAAAGLALLLATPALAQAPASVAFRDAEDAAEDAPDLKRVGATRLKGGDVRFALSLGSALSARDLRTDADADGPPGSLCVRIWTRSTPGATAPDLLACVTSQPDGRTFRSTITKEVPGALPSTVGTATLSRPSETSVALVVAKSLLGTVRTLRFAVEATRPGCVRLSCTDLAPDSGTPRSLRLR